MTNTRTLSFGLIAGTVAAGLTWAGPALAGAGPGAADGYGYHHGWSGHGWGGMIGGPLLALLFIAAATVVVVLVARAMMRGRCCHRHHGRCGHAQGHGGANALMILEERYAKGEIDTAEFNERKKALAGD